MLGMQFQVWFMISFEFGKFRKDCNILRYDTEHFRTRNKIFMCPKPPVSPIGTIKKIILSQEHFDHNSNLAGCC